MVPMFGARRALVALPFRLQGRGGQLRAGASVLKRGRRSPARSRALLSQDRSGQSLAGGRIRIGDPCSEVTEWEVFEAGCDPVAMGVCAVLYVLCDGCVIVLPVLLFDFFFQLIDQFIYRHRGLNADLDLR